MVTHNPPPHPANSLRVRHAREVLAESKQATPNGGVDSAIWWGRLESIVESLLEVIEEQAPGGAQ